MHRSRVRRLRVLAVAGGVLLAASVWAAGGFSTSVVHIGLAVVLGCAFAGGFIVTIEAVARRR
jgi:hypothetical protein